MPGLFDPFRVYDARPDLQQYRRCGSNPRGTQVVIAIETLSCTWNQAQAHRLTTRVTDYAIPRRLGRGVAVHWRSEIAATSRRTGMTTGVALSNLASKLYIECGG
jgi:hypothetical protein